MCIKFKKLFLIFLVSMFIINSLIASNEKEDEYSLKLDEELIWVINLIDKYNYEALISTRMKEDTYYFLIDRSASNIDVFDPNDEVDIPNSNIETFSNIEELKEEAEILKSKVGEKAGEDFLKRFIGDLYSNKVLRMQIKECDTDKLPLEIRIRYDGVPNLPVYKMYQNHIEIHFGGERTKISRFYLVFSEMDVWTIKTEVDFDDQINGKIRLMWKVSERNLEYIHVTAGTYWERLHWENRETSIWFFILTATGLFFTMTGIVFSAGLKRYNLHRDRRNRLIILSLPLVVFLVAMVWYVFFKLNLGEFPIDTTLQEYSLCAFIAVFIIYLLLVKYMYNRIPKV